MDLKALRSIEGMGDVPVFLWSEDVQKNHFLFHSVCRSLLLGDCETVLLVQRTVSGMAAAFLASPKAVGRYNLLPVIRLTNRWEINLSLENGTDFWEPILHGLEEKQVPLTEIRLVSLSDGKNSNIKETKLPFLSAEWQEDDSSSTLVSRLNHLVHNMEDHAFGLGLLISVKPRSPGSITLLERI